MQHAGIFHIAVGSWALLTFGPKVCKSYGSFTFVLIYILGGISGNLTSFLHTPEPTVGGTVSCTAFFLFHAFPDCAAYIFLLLNAIVLRMSLSY